MTQMQIYSSEALFIVVLVLSMMLMLYYFGRDIINLRFDNQENNESTITTRDVTRYFSEKGYIVCTATPVKDSNKWIAFLVKNGEYLIATVFTKDNRIERHSDSLE